VGQVDGVVEGREGHSKMYVPPSRGGGGASAAGEQSRVYQVWRGSNVSAPSPTVPVGHLFWILVC
jgi:hypothetical protein